MTLLELNKIIAGKINDPVDKPLSTMTREDFKTFKDNLSVNNVYVAGIQRIESATEYYNAFEFMKEVTPAHLREDLFYAGKLGYFYEGVPGKLVYLLVKAAANYDTPNNIISSVDSRVWKKYERGLGNNITIQQVLENVINEKVDLLTKFRKITRFKDCYEVYVENVDRVLIISGDMQKFVKSKEDLDSVEYIKNIGVCVQGTPLRISGTHLGLVFDEYDLRGCQ